MEKQFVLPSSILEKEVFFFAAGRIHYLIKAQMQQRLL